MNERKVCEPLWPKPRHPSHGSGTRTVLAHEDQATAQERIADALERIASALEGVQRNTRRAGLGPG